LHETNHLQLLAELTERDALRYTPAGLPALNCGLQHTSPQEEASLQRQVQLNLRGVAVGAVAERLNLIPLGTQHWFSGFLASPRNGKQVVFHIQAFHQDPNRS